MEAFKRHIAEKLEESKKVGMGFIEIQLSDEKFCEWVEENCRFKVVGSNIDLYSFPKYFNPAACISVLLYNIYKMRGKDRFVTVYLSPEQEDECKVKGLSIEYRIYRIYNLICQ